MRYKEVIYLMSVTVTEDALFNQIPATTERRVFANEFTVSNSYFYNNALTGTRPDKIFQVYTLEYKGEDRLKYKDIVYRITHAETRGENTRLSCERVAADE